MGQLRAWLRLVLTTAVVGGILVIGAGVASAASAADGETVSTVAQNTDGGPGHGQVVCVAANSNCPGASSGSGESAGSSGSVDEAVPTVDTSASSDAATTDEQVTSEQGSTSKASKARKHWKFKQLFALKWSGSTPACKNKK